MEVQPKKLISRIVEFAALLALSAFLVRLAAHYILDVWPVLLIVCIGIAVVIVLFRLWKWKRRERW